MLHSDEAIGLGLLHDTFCSQSAQGNRRRNPAWWRYGTRRRPRWENLVESVITRRSAEEMALKTGDAVKVVIKSTEVMLQKD